MKTVDFIKDLEELMFFWSVGITPIIIVTSITIPLLSTSTPQMFEQILDKSQAKGEKIDWHNYKAMEAEKQRTGP